MLAFAMMAAIRHHANATPPPKRTAEDDVKDRKNLIAIDPLVGPRNPSHRHPSCTTTDQPPHVIAWSVWRRAIQAVRSRSSIKRNSQL